MESYYSSDEEIAWGPVTLREIKGDLKRPVLRKPNRRHTVLATVDISNMESSNTPESPSELVSEETSKLSISGTSTAYYTPNESLKTNSNSDFLEKVSEIINIRRVELSEYASILEETANSNIASEQALRTDEISHVLDASKSDKTYITSPNPNDTCANFIKALENRKTHYDIGRFQQTLVENSIILSDDENEGMDGNKEHFQKEEKLEMEEHTVIVISDNDSSFVETDNDEIQITYCKKEISNNGYEEVDEDIETEDIANDDDKNALGSGSNVCSSEENIYISEENVYNSEENLNNSGENEGVTQENDVLTPHKLSTIKESLSTSPVVIPQIDLSQFDDSKDDSFQLNDTLEEMNRLLCQGVNYCMSDDEVIEKTPAKTEIEPEQLFTSPLTKSASSAKSSQKLFSGSKDKVSHIPRRNFISKSAEKYQINKHITKNTSPKPNFKVPITPLLKTKSTSNLKNIPSPVALYIKSSPRFPLHQNVPLRELSKVVVKSGKSANKENYPEFPEVVYKPSKKQISSCEKHIVIPMSIRKLNIKGSCITKHEGRINHEVDEFDVREKLQQPDITNSTINQSMLDNSNDISVLTSKQAFIH